MTSEPTDACENVTNEPTLAVDVGPDSTTYMNARRQNVTNEPALAVQDDGGRGVWSAEWCRSFVPATIVMQRETPVWQTARPSSRPWWWHFASLSLRGMIAFMALIAAPLVWFSKSVRRVIVVVVIIAAPMAWISNGARVQREVVTAIEKAGGKVWYDFEWSDGGASGEIPIWPEWLVKALGPDYFGHVVSVSFTSRATDAELIQVAKLERVERLDLYGSDVSDRGVMPLKH